MEKGKGFDLRNLSAARPHLLGLATLWVALFHSYFLDFFQSPLLTSARLVGVLNRLKETGNCGVDLFLFLSGFGLYYSFSRLRESSPRPVRDFYRRRFSLVLPPVLTVCVLYYSLTETEGLADWLGQVSLLGILFPGQAQIGYWYFTLLLLLYLLFPLIWRLIRRFGPGGAAAAGLLSVGASLLLRAWQPAYFDQTEILWTRIPVFLAGTAFGKAALEGKRIPRWIPLLCIPLSLAGLAAVSRIPGSLIFLRRYAYGLWAVALALAHGFLCSLPKRRSPLYRAVCAVGTFSLEMYLIHERIYMADPSPFLPNDPVGLTRAAAAFVAALLLSALLRTALGALRKAFRAACARPGTEAGGGSPA